MTAEISSADTRKRNAAVAALAYVRSGMKLGLGTGSTADQFLDVLAAEIREGLDVIGVPTSEKTRQTAVRLGIPLTTLDETPRLDLAIDGADEIDPELRLIKGGGGALLIEKIVAAAAERMIVIADDSKYVDRLGAFPLPIEIVPFGTSATRQAIDRLARDLGLDGPLVLREGPEGKPFVTDCGNFIVDASFGVIEQAEALAAGLNEIPGVVEHGLFLAMADTALVAGDEGVQIFTGAPR